MPFEVEMKFPTADAQPTVSRLVELGATFRGTVQQADTYFNHPSRDFGKTDEALRVRVTDGRAAVTYKGPRIDAVTKTRAEIEIPVGRDAHDGDGFQRILSHLGFREVRTVRKTRDYYDLEFEGRSFEACVDRVEAVGQFIELETVADETGLDAARESIQRLAHHLGLEKSERRSYLCLLLEADQTTDRTDGHG